MTAAIDERAARKWKLRGKKVRAARNVTGKSGRSLGCSLCPRAYIYSIYHVCVFPKFRCIARTRASVCVYASHVLHCSEWKSNRWPFRFCDTIPDRSELLDEADVVHRTFLNPKVSSIEWGGDAYGVTKLRFVLHFRCKGECLILELNILLVSCKNQ